MVVNRDPNFRDSFFGVAFEKLRCEQLARDSPGHEVFVLGKVEVNIAKQNVAGAKLMEPDIEVVVDVLRAFRTRGLRQKNDPLLITGLSA